MSPNKPAMTPNPTAFDISLKLYPNGFIMYSIYKVNKVTVPRTNGKQHDNNR